MCCDSLARQARECNLKSLLLESRWYRPQNLTDSRGRKRLFLYCRGRTMASLKYYQPEYESENFHCAHCGVYASQYWGYLCTRKMTGVTHISRGQSLSDKFATSICSHCREWSIWVEESLVYPAQITVEDPNDDMPDEVKNYIESLLKFCLFHHVRLQHC